MRVIGIVGGVASGKSLVAERLRELGAAVIDGDRAGHEALRDPEVIQAARDRWGDQIIGTGGQIDRAALGGIVFGPSPGAEGELKHLEKLTHGRIADALRRQIDDFRAKGQTEIVVLDAAVLLKAGWGDFCDKILFVDAPREVRLSRARGRGWDEEEFERRERAQQPVEVKKARADEIIENSGTPEQLRQRIGQFWDSLFD